MRFPCLAGGLPSEVLLRTLPSSKRYAAKGYAEVNTVSVAADAADSSMYQSMNSFTILELTGERSVNCSAYMLSAIIQVCTHNVLLQSQ